MHSARVYFQAMNTRETNFNLRQTMNLTSKLTVDVKANYIIEDIENRPLSGAGNRAVSTLYAMPRSLRLSDISNFETLNPDGSLTQNYWAAIEKPDFQNPYWTAYRNLYERKNRIIGLAAIKYQFTPRTKYTVKEQH